MTIRYGKDNFDDDATFMVAHPRAGRVPMVAYLFCPAWHNKYTGDTFYGQNPDSEDHHTVFVMQKTTVIKAHYTESDIENAQRRAEMTPLKDGEVVEIEGEGKFKFKLIGDYSTIGEFVKVN